MKRGICLLLAVLLSCGLAATALAEAVPVEEIAEAAAVTEDLAAEAVEVEEAAEGEAPEEEALVGEPDGEPAEEPAEANTAELPNFHYDGSRYATFDDVGGAASYYIGNEINGLHKIPSESLGVTRAGTKWTVDLKAHMDAMARDNSRIRSGDYTITIYAYNGSLETLAQSSVGYTYLCTLPQMKEPSIWWKGTKLYWTIPEHAVYLYFTLRVYDSEGKQVDEHQWNGFPNNSPEDIAGGSKTVNSAYRYQATLLFKGEGDYLDLRVTSPMCTGAQLLFGNTFEGDEEYAITVTGGTASKAKAKAGEIVTITADDRSAQYMTFSYWFYTEGTVVENYKSATTTFVMPDHDVTFVAQYDVEYQEELFVTVPEPGIGEKPGVPTVATDEYSIEKYRWLDVNTDTVLGEGAVFEADKYYQLQVDLKCKRFVAQHPIYAVNGVCDEYIRLSRTGNKAKIIATFIPVEKPAPTTLKKVKKGKKKLTVVWKKQAKGTNGYVVQYATKEDFSDAQEKYVKKPKTTKLTIKKLKAKTKYYVRVCTYRLDDGKMVRSDWSNVKSAKTR